MKNIENVTDRTFNELLQEYIKTNKAKGFFKTGFAHIDKIVEGFYPGEVIIIGGRPAMGKTTFSLDLMKNISIDTDYKVPLAFVTLELNREQLFRKLMKTYIQNKIDKRLFSYDLQRVDNIQKSPMYILDTTGNNISAIIKCCKELINIMRVKFIIIDYVQLITSASKEDNPDTEITKIMAKLKKLAVKRGVVVIVLSQLSKDIDKRLSEGGEGPKFCDFQESESLFNIPDKVIFIHRPEYYRNRERRNTDGLVEINIVKNNNGKAGKALLKFDVLNCTYEDYYNSQ